MIPLNSFSAGHLEALDVADLDGMLYEFALRTRIDIDSCPAIADKILSLRATLSERLSKQSLQALLIEPFDPQKYNPRISIAENLLFGKPIGEALDIRHLADNPVVRRVLKRSKMDATLIDFGHEIAQAAVSLAEQGITREEMASEYLPVAADEIPLFSLIVGLAARAGPERLPRGYKRTLESLALRANPARHRQIVIPPPLQTQILSARLTIKERLSAQLSAMIEFFDPAAYNSALTIRENIIFGEIASNDATASRRVNDAILEISEGEDLRSLLKQLGLSFQVGTGGSNLSPVQQQKLGIARAVIKRPKVLVMSNALTGLDTASIERIHSGLTREMTGRIILCHTGDARVAALFERTIELRSGRVITDSANVTDAHS